MSRYPIEAKDPKYAVVVGWDNPLQTFFGQVIDKTSDRDWDLKLWAGTNPREIGSIAELQDRLKEYAVIPKEVQNALAFDQGPLEHWPAAERESGLGR
jgi:hypothetical protein